MIAANEAVARHLRDVGMPFLYRVHPEPDPERLETLFDTLEATGFEDLPSRPTAAAMQGVLADPGPSASIEAVGDSAVTINYFAWVDQRQTDFVKARSEAIRLVKTALEDAGMDLPEPIYRVQLTLPEGHDADTAAAALPPVLAPLVAPTPAAAAPAPVDPQAVVRTQGDVSPNTELDAQIAQERARKAGQDMLQAPGGKTD